MQTGPPRSSRFNVSTLGPVEDVDRTQGVRLAELVAAFSLATDLGLGQPMEHLLRSWVIAARLGRHAGLEDEVRESLYYVVTLGWTGCVADTPEVAAWFGDDIAFRRDSYEVDRTGSKMLGFALRHVGTGSPPLHRIRLGATLMATQGAGVERGLISHCLTTATLADRLGLDRQVCDSLQQVFTRWDGKGVPAEIAGEEIAPAIRLFHLAENAEVFHRGDGIGAAVELARARRGTQFDPAVVDAFCGAADELLADLDGVSDWNELTEQEPALQARLAGPELDTALEAVADFTDLRSPTRAGHSRAVASLAARAAELSGLPASEVTTLRRAGLVHDLGLHGVPATVMEKPGPLSTSEAERMRMRSYYTERMLARPAALARIGAVAALANERLDGSGYHRGLAGPAISANGRILAAACAFCAMTEPRPHRPARSAAQATEILAAEARSGRLAVEAVDAVLAAAGKRRGRGSAGPGGLTAREIEVLRLIARGASNRQVARALGITPKTAGTHIERIYTKTGASTRSTATLFAMQHGLLDALEPLEP